MKRYNIILIQREIIFKIDHMVIALRLFHNLIIHINEFQMWDMSHYKGSNSTSKLQSIFKYSLCCVDFSVKTE